MTIDKIDVNVCSPGRNFVTLKIVTSDGVVGWGDATLNGRELCRRLPVRAPGIDADRPRRRPHRGHLAVPVPRRLLAARPGHHGRHRRRRHGPVGHQGQKAGMPLYQLLGGASRDQIRVYGHASGPDYAALKDAISGYIEAGYTARVQTGVPGLGQIYGVATNKPGTRYDYEPAHRAADGSAATALIEEIWDGLPVAHAGDLFADPRRLRNRRAGLTRRAPPDDPHRGGPIRQRG